LGLFYHFIDGFLYVRNDEELELPFGEECLREVVFDVDIFSVDWSGYSENGRDFFEDMQHDGNHSFRGVVLVSDLVFACSKSSLARSFFMTES
jgi:hypothetical protein